MKKSIIPFLVLVIFVYTFYQFFKDVFFIEFDLIKFICMILLILGILFYGFSLWRKLNGKEKK